MLMPIGTNAFQILMPKAPEYVLPPKHIPSNGKVLRQDLHLYNDIVGT